MTDRKSSSVPPVATGSAAPRPRRRRPSRLVQLLSVFRKEVLQTVRDRRVMFLLIVAPLIQTVAFGFAVDFDVDNVPAVVVDLDKSVESRLHARRLLADGTLVRFSDVEDVHLAERALERGDAALAVVLPNDLERNLVSKHPAHVQVLLDGTDPNRATVAAGAVARYFGEVGHKLGNREMAARGIHVGSTEVDPRVLFNPSLRTAPYIIPGVIGMLLLIVTTVVTAMGLSRERETGTLEQVLVTPLEPWQLLIGKMAPFLVIGLLDVALVLASGSYLFDMPLHGDLRVVATATFLYLLTTLGMGLFIAASSKTQQQAFLGGFLFLLPAILLSGVMTPVRAMPEWMQTVTLINPVRYYVEVMRAVLLKGSGFSEVSFQLLSLTAFGLGIFGFSVLRFRRRLA
jgi:ABC-2 type transport system permease protein